MSSKITIRPCRPAEAESAARLVCSVFRRYVDPGESEDFLDALCERIVHAPYCRLAVDGIRVVGIVLCRQKRIVNLYVDPSYHRRGIATRLIKGFETYCRRGSFDKIVLRSSLYAVPFYQACGYRKSTGVRHFRGLRVQPMKKTLTGDVT